MNQILITDTVYVTPELRRKKKIYKVLFIISSFLLVCFSTLYIYAEYDRNKETKIEFASLDKLYFSIGILGSSIKS